MLEIWNLTHGEILNHHHGTETGEGLKMVVAGLARSGDRVTVNGIPAVRCGERFSAEIELKQRFNEILVAADGNRGSASRSIRVVWDKASFRRVNFCIDDNIFVFRDIARTRPKSIFDHFYLKSLRVLHEKYGLRLTLNLFYEDLTSGFTLDQFPDCYRSEWERNADWLRLAFHARAEFPDRIYQNAEVGTLLHDFDQVNAEIRRFAGETVLIAPPNIHWAMVKPDAIPELRKRGVHFLGGLFLDAQTRIGESVGEQPACDIGYFQNEENSRFLQQRRLWHDFRCGVTMGTEAAVLNLEEPPALRAKLEALTAQADNEAFHLLTHEQYFFPEYAQYLPDHFDRMEIMAERLSRGGFQFVFFNEGFLGNPAVC